MRETLRRLEPNVRRLAGAVMDVLVPCRCLHCDEVEPGSMHLGLCSRCRARLEPANSPRRSACDLCGATLEELPKKGPPGARTGRGARAAAGPVARARAASARGGTSTAALGARTRRPPTRRCIPCLQKKSPLDRLYFVWRYQEPLDAVIHALKFEELTYLGGHIARELDRVLPRELELDAAVPVPLHWRRGWLRGYNQAAEIARPLARRRGWRLSQVLVRRRATRAQSGLARADRLGNLRRAFAVRGAGRGAEITGKRLLLVDDVVTTGATLEAAAGALVSGGAAWVGAAVAGRTGEAKYYERASLHPLTE